MFSIVPPLLATIIETQNRLLGLAYTAIHQFSVENGFQSPPPPMESVVADWDADFGPVLKEIETFYIVKSGKFVRQAAPASGGTARPVLSSPAPTMQRNGVQRAPSGLIPSAGLTAGDSRRPSASREPSPSPAPSSASMGSGVATDFTVATKLNNSSVVSTPSLRAGSDYFGHATGRHQTSDIARAVANKKKPPPPPPKKPGLGRPEETVMALYDFESEGQGDLSFREGDLIKIIKKTGTDQDWWVGELRGVRGNFPANYCRPA